VFRRVRDEIKRRIETWLRQEVLVPGTGSS
jgi:hypothetical protein